MTKTKSYKKIIRLLESLYPNPKSELNFTNEYELIISVLLSAQCTDKKVNEVTPSLFKKYSNFQKLSLAKVSEIETIIRPINYYKTKSKNLFNLAKKILYDFKGQIPRTFEELVTLPGVGRKTANVVLGELGIASTFPVDTHVFRVSKRLGIATGNNPIEVEESLKKFFPSEYWRLAHHSLIFHGRRVCKASSPKCEECKLRTICRSYKLNQINT